MQTEVYNKEVRLSGENLSDAQLFMILQEVSSEHCSRLGLGMDVLGPKGLIWVVVRQYVKLERPLRAGEKLNISTWPGPTRHMMFPRYFVFRDENGDVLLKGSAVWTLVDADTRRMVRPEKYGVELQGIVTGEETRLPSAAPKAEPDRSTDFLVPMEYMDSNRHMNNTRYYEMSEHCMGTEGRSLREAHTDYISEALPGETIRLSWTEKDGRFYISGENGGPVFRMCLEYF